jgi:hypothetical protein
MLLRRYKYDAFISHAVEDKISIANELCAKLEERNIKVWYSGQELNAGDTLNHEIQQGLEASQFGVIIFSHTYINKTWTMRELYHFLPAQEKDRTKARIIPILHNGITAEDLAKKHVSIANIFAIQSSKGIDGIADHVSEVIKAEQVEQQYEDRRKLLAIGILFLLFIASVISYYKFIDNSITGAFIQHTVEERMNDYEAKIDQAVGYANDAERGVSSNQEKIVRLFGEYSETRSHYRNEYVFNTDREVVSGQRKVMSALGLSLEQLSPSMNYGFKKASIYESGDSNNKSRRVYRYRSLDELGYEIVNTFKGDNECKVVVRYLNNVRLVTVSLDFFDPRNFKRQHVEIDGFPPIEEYNFVYEEDKWRLLSVD